MSYTVKQVIVVRDDLKMRKGKFAAQVAHASMKVFLDMKMRLPNALNDGTKVVQVSWGSTPSASSSDVKVCFDVLARLLLAVSMTEDMATWVHGTFAKIVLLVNSEEELLRTLELAQEAGLPCAMVTDLGFTEFHGEPTHTAVAIGPAKSEEIDKITGPGSLVPTRLA
jgi:PTH2 family peptidyl-tRNA hydrolase